MPEIKLKHVVSFSSEDKVHKAENLVKPETYRKWKCATPGEKNATIILQFEKASQIHSIDLGNEASAFVEILVGRSSDSAGNFQVLLVASSFMSPLESRNETHTNRVRMFGPEKLSQSVKDEKWDCVQIVCTQPFNKNIAFGLSFIKFHSPSEKAEDVPINAEAENAPSKLGSFIVKSDDEDDSLLTVGSWFGKQKAQVSEDNSSSVADEDSPSYAAAVLASSSIMTNVSPKNNTLKRKIDNATSVSNQPPPKKPPASNLKKNFIVYKPLDMSPERKKPNVEDGSTSKNPLSNKKPPNKNASEIINKPSTSKTPEPVKKKIQTGGKMKKVVIGGIMEKVVIVLSGFVNPMRSDLRDKALDMGAKYKGDWDKSCTHLVCAFTNTPKYVQVRAHDGRIVSKEWILDCHRTGALLPWRDYMLGKYTKDSSEDEESEAVETDEEYESTRTKKNVAIPVKKAIKTNGIGSPIIKAPSAPKNNTLSSNQPKFSFLDDDSRPKEESETEDEDALNDYIANTDVDTESDSGGDTEDELRKVDEVLAELRKGKKTGCPTKVMGSESEEHSEKPNVDDLPLPILPNLFKQKHFYLFGDFPDSKRHDMRRYITAYNGVIEDYMSDKIKYVITEAKYDEKFDEALSENEDLLFIKPSWIYKCHEAEKLVPYQPFIVIPDS